MIKSIFRCMPLVILLAAGCDKPSDDKKSKQTEMNSETATAEEGPGEFTLDYENSGNFFTKTSQIYDGDSAHGRVRIWYSKNVEELIQQQDFKVPVGTISIKQGYFDENDQFGKIVTMIKRDPGYDPENNDWEYEVRGRDGTLEKNGKIAGCISCHKNAPETDYLMGTQVSN